MGTYGPHQSRGRERFGLLHDASFGVTGVALVEVMLKPMRTPELPDDWAVEPGATHYARVISG
ncbi:MAG TPA: hypothetical protein VLK82_16925 [Candidatus Tectomicrobia bacterium]|nr:hypothetical protein [Candidatus Tectomicrobia bacterium]